MAKIYHRYILQKIYLIEFFNFLKHAIFNQNSLIWEREKKKNIQRKEHRNREDFVSLFIGTQIKNYHFKTNKRKSRSIKFETFLFYSIQSWTHANMEKEFEQWQQFCAICKDNE